MGVTFRATTLIVATTVVTLSSAANANHRHYAARGEHWYGIRWCSTTSADFGLPYFYPCGRSRHYYSGGYRRYYSDRYRYY
jgi:hypothetical protein